MKQPAGSGQWRNWAGTATATPARWAQPRTEAEISAAVKGAAAAGLQVRALGSGHSFTSAAATGGLALDLSLWQKGEVGDLGAHEQVGRGILARCDARAAADTGG